MSLMCAGASTDKEDGIKEKLQEKINSNAKVYFIILLTASLIAQEVIYNKKKKN